MRLNRSVINENIILVSLKDRFLEFFCRRRWYLNLNNLEKNDELKNIYVKLRISKYVTENKK